MMRRVLITLVTLLATVATDAAMARTVRTAHFTITLPAREDPSPIADALERAYRIVRESGLRLPSMINVVVHPTTTAFAMRSGATRVHIAATRGTTMHVQPLAVIRRQRNIESSLAHEIVHVALAGAAGRAPRWLLEGFAMVVAGQGHPVRSTYASAAALERAISDGGSHDATRDSYAVAGKLASDLVALLGLARTAQALQSIARGADTNTTFNRLLAVDLERWASARLALLKLLAPVPHR